LTVGAFTNAFALLKLKFEFKTVTSSPKYNVTPDML